MFFAIATAGAIKGLAGMKALAMVAIVWVLFIGLVAWVCRENVKSLNKDGGKK